jgi:cytidylate kinase
MDQKSSSARLAEAVAKTRRRWQTQREAEVVAGATVPLSPSPFTIAITREAGAKGSVIAAAIAEKLGWPVYNRELLEHIAKEMQVDKSLLEEVDEKHKGWVRECLESILAVPAVSASSYFHYLLQTLLTLAAHGECVIVGRGAAQVLPAATTLRVRLVGPVADRIQVIRRRRGVSPEEAKHWIDNVDAERARFVREHFLKDPNDSRFCDLTLNSSRFSVGQCAEIIIAAGVNRFRPGLQDKQFSGLPVPGPLNVPRPLPHEGSGEEKIRRSMYFSWHTSPESQGTAGDGQIDAGQVLPRISDKLLQAILVTEIVSLAVKFRLTRGVELIDSHAANRIGGEASRVVLVASFDAEIRTHKRHKSFFHPGGHPVVVNPAQGDG